MAAARAGWRQSTVQIAGLDLASLAGLASIRLRLLTNPTA